MRTQIIFLNIFVLSTVILSSTVYGQRTWELYDDFNSGTIDADKWIIDDSSAVITIEDNQAKFMHQDGHPGDSSYLEIADKTIAGVSATITVTSCSGDVKARILSNLGRIGEDIAFSELAVHPVDANNSTRVLIAGPAPDYTFRYMLFSGSFQTPPLPIIGNPFTISSTMNHQFVNYRVDGEGEMEFSFPSTLEPAEEDAIFTGIGTRSSSGVGECTVYFDDVHVLRIEPFNWSYIVPILSGSQ